MSGPQPPTRTYPANAMSSACRQSWLLRGVIQVPETGGSTLPLGTCSATFASLAPIPLLLPLLLLLAAPAPAQPTRATLVVLVEDTSLPAGTSSAVNAALKREVDRSALYVWKEPPPISVDEILLALSCKKSNLGCIQKMGPILSTDTVALVAGVGGKSVTLTVVQFNADKRVFTETVPWGDAAALSRDTSQALRRVLGPTRAGSLSVLSTPPGAQVDVDGVPVGVTPLLLQDVAPAQKAVHVSMAGYLPQKAMVPVESGAQAEWSVTLEAQPVVAPAPVAPVAKAESAPGGSSPMAGPLKWALVGVGAAGGVLALVVGVAGAAMLAGAGGLWAYAWNDPNVEQRFVTQTLPVLYFPLSVGGGVLGALGLVLLPVGAALVVGGFVLGAVLG